MDSDTIRKLLAEATPGPWTMETVRTSCGICHRIGPFKHQWRGGDVSHACLYEDYPPSPVGTHVMVANASLIAAAPDLATEVLRLRDRLIAEEEVKIRLAYRAAEEIGKLKDALAFYANPAAWNQKPVETVETVIGTAYRNEAAEMQKDRGAIARAAMKEADNARLVRLVEAEDGA